MKNIHLLPTKKPSILYAKDDNYKLANSTMAMDWYISSAGYKPYNIYITSDEEIKEGDWVLYTKGIKIHYSKITNSGDKELANIKGSGVFKIILTTDPDLIADGVQAIDDKFLEWFVKNPSCEEVEVEIETTSIQLPQQQLSENSYDLAFRWINKKVYKIIIPKEEPNYMVKGGSDAVFPSSTIIEFNIKQETLKEDFESYELAETLFKEIYNYEPEIIKFNQQHEMIVASLQKGIVYGAEYQAKRMFSNDEVNEIIAESWNSCEDNEGETFTEARKRILEKFKKI